MGVLEKSQDKAICRLRGGWGRMPLAGPSVAHMVHQMWSGGRDQGQQTEHCPERDQPSTRAYAHRLSHLTGASMEIWPAF